MVVWLEQIDASKLCVAKVPFFNHLTDSEMFKVAERATHKNYHKDELILHDGESLDYLYIVHQGRVKIYQIFESGKEQLLRILEPGEFMGEMALFTKKEMDSYAEAMEKTEVCVIHRNEMQQLMKEHPTIAIKILEQFSSRLDETEKLVGELSGKDVEMRIASYLVELAEKTNSTQIVLPMSKKELASYLGTTRETVSRRLSTFQTNGWIDQDGHRNLELKNLEALKKIGSGV